MKKMFVLLLAGVICIISACAKCQNKIKVYYSNSGGFSVLLDLKGIEEEDDVRNWPDPEAERNRQIDFMGSVINGDYTGTLQSNWYKTKDEYIKKENEKNIYFAVDRESSKVLTYSNNYNRNYVWPDNYSKAILTENDCLDIAVNYLKQFTELYSEYSLASVRTEDYHLPNWPISYEYIFELNTAVHCDDIYITIRSDGELTFISHQKEIDNLTYETAKLVNLKKLYGASDKAIKTKLGDQYDRYNIERSESLPDLAMPYYGGLFVRVAYLISNEKTDLYPNQLIVYVPIEMCI